MIKRDLHVHLHGCLTPQQLWEIGKDCYKKQASMLDWYAAQYEKAWQRKPHYRAYWEHENGYDMLKKDYIFAEKNSFERFQANFNLIIALCNISPDNFSIQERIIRHVQSYGLEYFEARTLIPVKFNEQQAYSYLKGLCSIVKNLNSELDMTTKLVFSLFRDNLQAEKHYAWIRLFMAQHPELAPEISGIDFAYAEEGSPPKTKFSLFKKFHDDNRRARPLNLLYHVGESFADKSIVSAIRWVMEAQELGANRLGHAIALGVNPENYRAVIVDESSEERHDSIKWLLENAQLLDAHGYQVDKATLKREQEELQQAPRQRIEYHADYRDDVKNLQKAVLRILKDRQVIIESCPTSNLRIGQIATHAYHPLRQFSEAGIKVVVGTDDPGIFGIDWYSEYELAKTLTAL